MTTKADRGVSHRPPPQIWPSVGKKVRSVEPPKKKKKGRESVEMMMAPVETGRITRLSIAPDNGGFVLTLYFLFGLGFYRDPAVVRNT